MNIPPRKGPQMTQETRRRLRRSVRAPILMVLVGYVAYFCYSRITYRPDPRMAYWEKKLREINPPKPGMMQFDDVSAFFEKNRDRGDANLAVMPINVIDYENLVRGPWDSEPSTDVARAIELFRSEGFQEDLSAFRETVRRGWTEPPQQILNQTNYNFRYDHREWCTVLLGYSRYLGMTRGDVVARSEVWREIAISTSQVERSRYFLANLSAADNRIRLGNEITLAVQETDAAMRIPSPDGLLASPEELAKRPTELVAGVVIRYRHWFDSMFVPGGGWMDVASAVETFYGQPVSRLWNVTSPVFYDRDETNEAFNELLAKIDECTTSGKLRDRFGSTLRTFPHDQAPLMMLRDPLPWRFCESLDWSYAGRTALEAAACTIALHNHRASNGEYPATLDRLVPGELSRLPIDFGNGKSLTYRRTGSGYLLYGVGGDGVDDHAVTGQPMIERSIRIWRAVGADFPCSNFQRAAPR